MTASSLAAPGTGQRLWDPPAGARPRILDLMALVTERHGVPLPDYRSFHSWSIDHLEEFWMAVWDHYGVETSAPIETVLTTRAMPAARWFVGARLNYARHALRHKAAGPALIEETESRPPREIGWVELGRQIGAVAEGLRSLGVASGDRVVGYLPNIVEAVVAFLACASIGAVWSSCPPEFGVDAALSRFAQIEPRVLLAVDGYRHAGRPVDRAEQVAALRAGLPTVEVTVLIPYLDDNTSGITNVGDLNWSDLIANEAPLEFLDVPFDHPLYILYSSGTTGIPKAIVHGHGGILLEHLKMLDAQLDLRAGDRFFWFTTTGWMMWNYLVSGLLVGASVMLFDGSPTHPGPDRLWEMASQHRLTHFGVSATFLMSCRKQGLSPGERFDLSRLRHLGSTGSPLPAEGAQWAYDHVSATAVLGSASGGTDVCSAVVGAAPIVPVWAGEISCRCLGCDVRAFDADGREVSGEVGELVVVQPMPSMPVGLWGDHDGSRLRSTYYATYPGVWRHGDWIQFAERGSCVISGRSDATLNRGGIRMGTAEFYAVVEDHPAVDTALVVHLDPSTDRPAGLLVLLVQPQPGVEFGENPRRELAGMIRSRLSPRHVPDVILPIPTVPRTVTGKKLEVPVKRYLQGRSLDEVAEPGALADPESMRSLARAVRELRPEDPE